MGTLLKKWIDYDRLYGRSNIKYWGKNDLPTAAGRANVTSVWVMQNRLRNEYVKSPTIQEKKGKPYYKVVFREDNLPSYLPLASPIVIIVKKNGMEIRLLIDY